VQKHFFNGGALTTAANVARTNTLATQVDDIIHAEAARWGSAALNRTSWVTSKNDMLDFINLGLDDALPSGQTTWANPYPGGRTALIVEQLRGYQDPVGSAKALFPAGDDSAPLFSGNFRWPGQSAVQFQHHQSERQRHALLHDEWHRPAGHRRGDRGGAR
jgi:hypothetical protein